jgi:putative FmdB family regulatory protein
MVMKIPTYEYICQLCDVTYEETRGISENSKMIECIECGELLKRVFSTPTITFNGSGFYATDKKENTRNEKT